VWISDTAVVNCSYEILSVQQITLRIQTKSTVSPIFSHRHSTINRIAYCAWAQCHEIPSRKTDTDPGILDLGICFTGILDCAALSWGNESPMSIGQLIERIKNLFWTRWRTFFILTENWTPIPRASCLQSRHYTKSRWSREYGMLNNWNGRIQYICVHAVRIRSFQRTVCLVGRDTNAALVKTLCDFRALLMIYEIYAARRHVRAFLPERFYRWCTNPRSLHRLILEFRAANPSNCVLWRSVLKIHWNDLCT
jgi:hypothetical protein